MNAKITIHCYNQSEEDIKKLCTDISKHCVRSVQNLEWLP